MLQKIYACYKKIYACNKKYMHATKKYMYATKNICMQENIYMLQKIYVCKKNICARIFGKLIWSVLLTLFRFFANNSKTINGIELIFSDF